MFITQIARRYLPLNIKLVFLSINYPLLLYNEILPLIKTKNIVIKIELFTKNDSKKKISRK